MSQSVKEHLILPQHQVAEIYPSIKSTWRLEFDLRRIPDPRPYPVTPMFLKAEVTICATHGMYNGVKRRQMAQRRQTHDGCCNKNAGYYLNLRAEFDNQRHPCMKCPDGSSPSYFGNWCEKCPNGSQRGEDEEFGCVESLVGKE